MGGPAFSLTLAWSWRVAPSRGQLIFLNYYFTYFSKKKRFEQWVIRVIFVWPSWFWSYLPGLVSAIKILMKRLGVPSPRIMDPPPTFVMLFVLKYFELSTSCWEISNVSVNVMTGTMSQRENSDLQMKMPLSNKYLFVFIKKPNTLRCLLSSLTFLWQKEHYITTLKLITQRSLSNNVFYSIFESK